jgi:hypothetical protein
VLDEGTVDIYGSTEVLDIEPFGQRRFVVNPTKSARVPPSDDI